jgi:hypothetical protein
MPPTPFLRPNALISVFNLEAACRRYRRQRVLAFAPMVNLEILKIS